MTEIRVLAVRQPWASLIIEGLKTIEVRSRSTNIRERVAIYASLSKQEILEGEIENDNKQRSNSTIFRGAPLHPSEIWYDRLYNMGSIHN